MVEAGQVRNEGTVSAPFDPPSVAGPIRSPKGSALRKDWQVQVLGVLQLPEGQTRLILHSLNKPGSEIIDLKGVRLRVLDDCR